MRILLLTLFQVLLAIHCCGQGETPGPTSAGGTEEGAVIPDITPQLLAAQLERPGVHVYDCNEADLYAEMHVPGAVLIVYDQITAEQLPADRSAMLVFYCYSPECPAATRRPRLRKHSVTPTCTTCWPASSVGRMRA